MAQSSSAPSARPVAVISPQYCAPYPVDLAVVKKIQTIFSSGNFAVAYINGNMIFQVKEFLTTIFHSHVRKLIRDAAGNPIVTLTRHMAINLHSRWKVFRGESTHPKDLLFSAKIHSVFNTKTKLDVFLANNTAEEVCDFKVKASLSQQSCTVYAGDEDSKTIVAQMHKNNAFFLQKEKFRVTVYPNIDHAFIVALIVILDDIQS